MVVPNEGSVFLDEEDITEYYAKMGVLMGNVDYEPLLELMGTHDWNLVGNWLKDKKKHKVFQFALANKFHDGVAAGIPPAVFNRKEVIDIVKDLDIGLVCDTPQDLLDNWDLHKEKRKNLLLKRRQLSMENYISNLTKIYAGL